MARKKYSRRYESLSKKINVALSCLRAKNNPQTNIHGWHLLKALYEEGLLEGKLTDVTRALKDVARQSMDGNRPGEALRAIQAGDKIGMPYPHLVSPTYRTLNNMMEERDGNGATYNLRPDLMDHSIDCLFDGVKVERIEVDTYWKEHEVQERTEYIRDRAIKRSKQITINNSSRKTIPSVDGLKSYIRYANNALQDFVLVAKVIYSGPVGFVDKKGEGTDEIIPREAYLVTFSTYPIIGITTKNPLEIQEDTIGLENMKRNMDKRLQRLPEGEKNILQLPNGCPTRSAISYLPPELADTLNYNLQE